MRLARFTNNKNVKTEDVKKDMTKFLAFQHNYNGIDIALFENDDVVEKVQDDKTHASKNIIPLTDSLLKNNNLTISDIDFIAINQGPGPFTTLRVIITTANGISFASKKPIVGIDGIKAFFNEHKNTNSSVTIAMLNAYSNDVYYAISPNKKEIQTGYKNIEVFLKEITQKHTNEKITLIGNGTELHKDMIRSIFDKKAILPEPMPQTCSIEQVGIEALQIWNSKDYKKTFQLTPLYLKQGNYKPSIQD